MGTPLTGSSVASTYTGLLKTSDNSALTTFLKAVGDGSGLDSALQLSTTAVNSTGDFSVGANKLTVAAASGNTVVGGTLTVTGATSLSGNLAIPGNLSVTGTSTLTGATSVASTLAVTGATSLSSVSTSGAAVVGTTLNVAGLSTLDSLGVTGAATVGTTLGVTGATTLATVGATTANIATLNVSGATTLASVGVTGAATVGTTLDVTGAATLSNNLTVTGNATVNGDTTIGNLGTDLLTINANVVTLPNLTNVTVDLANDKVLITDANDGSKLRSIAASALGINASNAPQCVQTIDTTRQTYSGSATAPGQEITVLNTTITPRSASSKILVTICINYSCLVNASQFVVFRLTRNSTEIGTSTGLGQKGISSGSYEDGEVTTINNKMIQFFDFPNTTSPVTYKLHNFGPLAAVQLFLNYATNDNAVSTSSTMVLQEYFAP